MPAQVSVVIKSYNHARYVGETIRGVLGQSFQDFEVVVTDYGSRDGTADIIRGFSDPRIDLKVFETNRGISAAMNDLLARARGEFIAIVNSDDYALPARLARQVAFLRANPDVAAVFDVPKIVDEEGKPAPGFFDFTPPASVSDLSQQSILRQFFFHGNFLCGPSAMVRRGVYARLGAYDPQLAVLQDFDMWVRLCAGHRIHIMREGLTAFRVLDQNRNASAPRRDTLLASQFELAQILRRYRAMDGGLLRATFGADLAAHGIASDARPDLWLARLALTASTPAHWLFALETLYQTADDDEALAQLREAAGRTDLFGFRARDEVDEIGRVKRALDLQIVELDRLVARRDEAIQTLLHSTSWRLTAPLRKLPRWMTWRRDR